MVKTIRLEDATHERLTKICRKDETYDEVVNRLLDVLEGKEQ